MPQTLWSLASDALTRHADQSAWICRLLQGNRRIYSYREIHNHALDLASRLRERGIAPGDVVSILSPNGPEWGVSALAIWRIGAVLAPIHTGLSDQEMKAQIKAVDPKLILVHGVDRRLDRAEEILLEMDTQRIEEESQKISPSDPEAEAVRIYTSGSTGNPKMVRLSHSNITSNVRAASKLLEIGTRDRFLSLLPLSHAMELTGGMMLPLYCGASIVLPRVLAATEIMLAMAEERISIMIAVPRLYRNLMHGLEKRLRMGSSLLRAYVGLVRITPMFLKQLVGGPLRKRFGGRLRCWLSGGSRLDPEISAYFHRLGIPLRQGYGLTETSPLISVQDYMASELDSVGKPVENVEVRIENPDESGSGELWVRGPNVMLGYTDRTQTAEVMEDGWFKTGDIARLDPVGNITLTGRSKRLIVTEAGKNVYPEELETLLERFDDVKEAGVLEVEMRPAAVLAVEGGPAQVARARRIIKEFNSGVSSHNQIVRFALVDELPRTPLGKVAIKKLPDIFAEKELTW